MLNCIILFCLDTSLIGNNAIHDLTKSGKMKLRIDLKKFNGYEEQVQHSTLKAGSKPDKYKLTLGGFTGSLGMSKWFLK